MPNLFFKNSDSGTSAFMDQLDSVLLDNWWIRPFPLFIVSAVPLFIAEQIDLSTPWRSWAAIGVIGYIILRLYYSWISLIPPSQYANKPSIENDLRKNLRSENILSQAPILNPSTSPLYVGYLNKMSSQNRVAMFLLLLATLALAIGIPYLEAATEISWAYSWGFPLAAFALIFVKHELMTFRISTKLFGEDLYESRELIRDALLDTDEFKNVGIWTKLSRPYIPR